jgi:hypothetical protein
MAAHVATAAPMATTMAAAAMPTAAAVSKRGTGCGQSRN